MSRLCNLLSRDAVAGTWVHVAATFDGQAWQVYVNGQLKGTHRLKMPGPASEMGGLILGGHREGVGRSYDGKLDDLALWSRVLSADEIKALYGNGQGCEITGQ